MAGVAGPGQDALDLVEGRTAGEHGLASEHLGDEAAQAPDVDAFRVAVRPQQDLGGAVPAGGHVLRHYAWFVVEVGGKGADQTEIADFDEALGVY